MSLNKSQVTKLVVDLYWDYDRMSSSGQETLDKLAKVLNIPTEEEQDKLLSEILNLKLSSFIIGLLAWGQVNLCCLIIKCLSQCPARVSILENSREFF